MAYNNRLAQLHPALLASAITDKPPTIKDAIVAGADQAIAAVAKIEKKNWNAHDLMVLDNIRTWAPQSDVKTVLEVLHAHRQELVSRYIVRLFYLKLVFTNFKFCRLLKLQPEFNFKESFPEHFSHFSVEEITRLSKYDVSEGKSSMETSKDSSNSNGIPIKRKYRKKSKIVDELKIIEKVEV